MSTTLETAHCAADYARAEEAASLAAETAMRIAVR